jgi:hypothetical protein
MNERLRVRFWVEMVLALVSGFLFLLTIMWRDWIENVFGVDPDAHSGAAEWTIVIACLAITGIAAFLARYEWRRAAVARA